MAVVAIDPGHGGGDPCAVGDILREDALTLVLALQVRYAARELHPGTPVVVLRSYDESVSRSKRNERAVGAEAGLVISIHANASQDATRRGALVLHHPGNPVGRAVADAITRAMPRPLFQEPQSRQPWATSPSQFPRAYALTSSYAATCVLVEVGYLTHAPDERALMNRGTLAGVRIAIHAGIARYLAVTADSAQKP